jgi:LysR family transcriptional regulator, glycine cleavage system transcriptional activator
MRQLPPLNAIRAFEAAARHLSFTRAADELNVTPAAISQQVRNLEDILGVPLFRRLTRALLLTEAGQLALPILGEGFDRLLDGIERIRAFEEGGILTVSAAPSFAARWLVRRLPRFEDRHPEIRIRVDPTLQVVDFERENVDIAVRFGEGNYPGMRTDRLMSENISPVCSPKLLAGGKVLKEPGDLANHVLLHTDWGLGNATQPDWAMWLLSAGADEVNPSRGPVFTTEILTVESALEGNGVALVNRGIVIDEVAAGRLIWPFELTLETKFGFFIVCPEQTADTTKNAAFREWLLDEARADGSI